MMSLSATFAGVGSFLGKTVSGLVLNLYSHQTVGIILGAFGFAANFVIVLLVQDPCEIQTANAKTSWSYLILSIEDKLKEYLLD